MAWSYRAILVIAMAAGAASAQQAEAGTVGKSFQVSGYYGVSCSASIAGNFNLGLVNPAANPINTTYQASSAIVVNCASAIPFSVWSALSGNASGTQRRMYNANANSYLNYNLWLNYDSNYLMPTSSTTSGSTAIAGSPTYVSGVTVTVPSGQTLAAGHYQDNIVITVSY
jgi:spore coat protein U-like protein